MSYNTSVNFVTFILNYTFAALAQIVVCLPLVQQGRGSIPGGVVNFPFEIFNLETRRGGDVTYTF